LVHSLWTVKSVGSGRRHVLKVGAKVYERSEKKFDPHFWVTESAAIIIEEADSRGWRAEFRVREFILVDSSVSVDVACYCNLFLS